MLKRCLVERCFLLPHAPAKIDDPFASRSAGQVHAIYPRPENVGIGPSVRIRRLAEPFSGLISGHIEGTALGIAHERNADVPALPLRLGQINVPRQIGMDRIHKLTIEPLFQRRSIIRS